LIKEPHTHTAFSPSDPAAGQGQPWVDSWLRVDLKNISKQLPYKILPFYVEIIPGREATDISHSIIQTNDGKAESNKQHQNWE
jgi:hypothetical protein